MTSRTTPTTSLQSDALSIFSTPRCWVAEAYIDSRGNRSTHEGADTVGIFAVCVNQYYATTANRRLELLRHVAQAYTDRVPAKRHCLFAFPAGFFVFNDESKALDLDKDLADIFALYPPNSNIAIGVDHFEEQTRQELAWLFSRNSDGHWRGTMIERAHTDLPNRKVKIGSVTAAFFVCGEFTGSYTVSNGPYYQGFYLTQPCSQLSDCQLLVDLAHLRVQGSRRGVSNPRWVHQRQMLEFSSHGAAVLTHHHSGGTDAKCLSNWIFFRGGEQFDEGQVRSIP